MRFLVVFLLGVFILTGCAQARKPAEEIGKPLGKTMDTLGGVSEGALEGYSETGREQPNPYDR